LKVSWYNNVLSSQTKGSIMWVIRLDEPDEWRAKRAIELGFEIILKPSLESDQLFVSSAVLYTTSAEAAGLIESSLNEIGISFEMRPADGPFTYTIPGLSTTELGRLLVTSFSDIRFNVVTVAKSIEES